MRSCGKTARLWSMVLSYLPQAICLILITEEASGTYRRLRKTAPFKDIYSFIHVHFPSFSHSCSPLLIDQRWLSMRRRMSQGRPRRRMSRKKARSKTARSSRNRGRILRLITFRPSESFLAENAREYSPRQGTDPDTIPSNTKVGWEFRRFCWVRVT